MDPAEKRSPWAQFKDAFDAMPQSLREELTRCKFTPSRPDLVVEAVDADGDIERQMKDWARQCAGSSTGGRSELREKVELLTNYWELAIECLHLHTVVRDADRRSAFAL